MTEGQLGGGKGYAKMEKLDVEIKKVQEEIQGVSREMGMVRANLVAIAEGKDSERSLEVHGPLYFQKQQTHLEGELQDRRRELLLLREKENILLKRQEALLISDP
eukprot:Cvel_27296.t1-p1 / transcript=Cvel_27296.t1 / gene=Cvel_27296 / organism=Chromera_velia_CCMP2878 / gene_product=hypothetical protein / transcript_product=hypothetical protein / location=Cvel_scaffold3384:1385-1697(-) / protein_length=104 / sequence_SO=supercontig / SO=protein_coding / is_pseudo=false